MKRTRRAAQAADRGQLRTAARLLRGCKLLPPTEATADAIEQLYQTGGEAPIRTDDAFEGTTHWLKSDVRQQHVLTHIRDAKRQAHPGPSGERNSHIPALLISPRGLTGLTQWVQQWADRRLDPWLQAKVIGKRQRRRQGQANRIRRNAPQDGHTIDTESSHFASSQTCGDVPTWYLPRVRCSRNSVEDSCENGRCTNEGVHCLRHQKTGSELQDEGTQSTEANDGARFWAQSLPTCGQGNEECNQQRGRTLRRAADQSRSETDSCRVRVRHRWPSRWP